MMANEPDGIVHHYPPELMALLVDAIPRLVKSKEDVLTFFKGAGVSARFTTDIAEQIRRDRDSTSKFAMVRQVLTRLNDAGESTLRERREILKRITEWDDYSSCWPNDQMKARGYVAEVQKLVNVKDSFTRMNIERERERQERMANREAGLAEVRRIKADREAIKQDLYALFKERDVFARGVALERVLNRLFKSYGISIRDAFRRIGLNGEGVIEQIDGVVEFDGAIYLVEMKWWSEPLGPGDVAQHLVRVFGRNAARGILISQSGYTAAAITSCRDSLHQIVFALANLEEIVFILEREVSLLEVLRRKVQAAIIDKNPFFESSGRS